jgi:hypothetical protein
MELLENNYKFVCNQNATLRSNIEETYIKNLEKVEIEEQKRLKHG